MRKPRTRWIPPGATIVMDKDRLGTIYLYSRDGQPAAIGYRGKSTKPDVHVIKTTQSDIEAVMRRWLDGLRNEAEFKKKCRAAREQDEWSRNNVIQRIKKSLAKRGLKCSVSGGRGTAWGWIHIDLLTSLDRLLTPEKRREAYRKLNEALGLEYSGAVSVPASTAYYKEFVDRAEGRKPATLGTPYWD